MREEEEKGVMRESINNFVHSMQLARGAIFIRLVAERDANVLLETEILK